MRRTTNEKDNPIVRKNLDLPYKVLEIQDKKASEENTSTKKRLENLIIKDAKRKK